MPEVQPCSIPLLLVCNAANDLLGVLERSGYHCGKAPSLTEAVQNAPESSAVLVLADAYPRAELTVRQQDLALAAAKQLRLYIEYPADLPGYAIAEPCSTTWERLVVSSDFFGSRLKPQTILVQHGCWYMPIVADEPHLVVARVAGYRHAVFGIPQEAKPILFTLPQQSVMVATTKLSQFVTGRYAPHKDWQSLWESLLNWLVPDVTFHLSCTPLVGVLADATSSLPINAERTALQRSLHWFRHHTLFSIGRRKGVIEGYESAIDYNGLQYPRNWIRADCMAESALVFAYDWAMNMNPDSRQIATRILDLVWSAPDFYQADLHSPAYGLMNWYERGPIFYGDDNARVIMPTLAVARLLNTDAWDEQVLRCLSANLRTTGRLGFRQERIELKALQENGWQHYRSADHVYMAPHFEAYLWACNIWAYGLTGYQGFLHPTIDAIRSTMAAYPRWQWTNGLSQEIARMLLPLAFLVRIDDSPEYRAWLEKMLQELLNLMQPCGAITERLGLPGYGRYSAPKSNAAYGSREASVVQNNGDPACDLLYTMNFAFLGIHEAAAALQQDSVSALEDKMADFLCRIQVHAPAHDYLDGAWMRSFDYDLWEYWGSSADAGWGAWAVETGWTNSWIATVLAMRARGESLFDLGMAARFQKRLPAILTEMVPV
jgi:hypothetical protein